VMEHFQGEAEKLPKAVAPNCAAILHQVGDELSPSLSMTRLQCGLTNPIIVSSQHFAHTGALVCGSERIPRWPIAASRSIPTPCSGAGSFNHRIRSTDTKVGSIPSCNRLDKTVLA